MGFHEFGEDLVLALQLGFEFFDILILGVFEGFGLASILERQMGVLEELSLPLVKERGIDLELIA